MMIENLIRANVRTNKSFVNQQLQSLISVIYYNDVKTFIHYKQGSISRPMRKPFYPFFGSMQIPTDGRGQKESDIAM